MRQSPSIPRQRDPEDPELARLRREFRGAWDITRATDYRGIAGAWHAVSLNPRTALQGVRADDADTLRAALTGVSR